MFKVAFGSLAFLLSFLTPHFALSANSTAAKLTGIRVQRMGAGVAVDLSFDKRVPARNLKPGFERNFVQFILKATRIDAARMIPVSESEVQKVFAYAYSPDVARLRIILGKDNQWAKGRISISNNNPHSVRVFIKDARTVAVLKPAEVSAVKKPVITEDQKPLEAPKQASLTEDNALLKEVVANTRDIDINNPESVKAAMNAPLGTLPPKSERREGSSGSIGISADPSRHFARMAIALFCVLGLFVGVLFVFKRYAGKLKKLPFGKKERLIQVVATHYLGNKKSISLVKITGEYMVVGVSNEGISLISKLGPEVNVDKYLEDRFWGGTFEKHLNTFSKDDKVAYDGPRDMGAAEVILPTAAIASADTIAEKITDRIELSPLRASIKEKLTKLKPL